MNLTLTKFKESRISNSASMFYTDFTVPNDFDFGLNRYPTDKYSDVFLPFESPWTWQNGDSEMWENIINKLRTDMIKLLNSRNIINELSDQINGNKWIPNVCILPTTPPINNVNITYKVICFGLLVNLENISSKIIYVITDNHTGDLSKK